MPGPDLSVEGVSVAFGPNRVLDDFSIHVDAGEIVGLLGPSGCGKSTLLRVVAGLQATRAGVVRVGGNDITDLPPHKRRVGLVFQDHQLFSHLDVAGNVGYALKIAKATKPQRAVRVAELLAMVDLVGFEHRSVLELSGGEAQRVALARSLAASPLVLLMDEPFSALDRELRERLVLDTRHVLKAVGITTIHVTHDASEAATMCDRVVHMPVIERTT